MGGKTMAGAANELVEKKTPILFTGQIHRPALVPIRKKGLSKCHSCLGSCKSILCPRPQHNSLCLGTSAPPGAAGLRCLRHPRPGCGAIC